MTGDITALREKVERVRRDCRESLRDGYHHPEMVGRLRAYNDVLDIIEEMER